MKKRSIKKIIVTTFSLLLLCVSVLAIHIYLVMRPKAPDAHTIVMARIDLKQQINNNDANKITTWLYRQKGIDHVLCNPETDIVVFTFYPVKANADEITSQLKSAFHLQDAARFIPTKADLASGCPVASSSFVYKAYKLITHIF